MRLANIELEWFRGAADPISLPLNGKSVVVYGPNGSGKSSFVDAIEYHLCDGRIGHLSHEYSGKKQEKGVINTHRPTLKPTQASLGFVDASRVAVNVKPNGAFTRSGDGQKHLSNLDYRRVVLRQDEVAAFISSPKGEKYSALLPLLGLEELEHAAENIRQLTKRFAKVTEYDAKQRELAAARGAVLPVEKLEQQVQDLHRKYRVAFDLEPTLAAEVREIRSAISSRVAELTPDVQKHEALRNLSGSTLEQSLTEVELVEQDLIQSSIKLLAERVAVLDGAATLIAAESEEQIRCPVCGSEVDRRELGDHLDSERTQLAADRLLLDRFDGATDRLISQIAATQAAALNDLCVAWWAAENPSGADDIEWLRALQPHAAKGASAGEIRESLRIHVLPMIKAARLATKNAPPGTEELLTDSEKNRAAQAALDVAELAAQVAKLTVILGHLEAVEKCLRTLIREKADDVVAEISTDIQRMWKILHPYQEIEDVRLRHPDDAEKAIDIELKFFGVELRSPRLTLSEGYRNSLGLCVFLAMAKRADVDVPVILDDVVVSLDRDHRGMIVGLLQSEFADRQVAIFTHDRDWFAELRHALEGPDWEFYMLKPFVSPSAGINWSSRGTKLDDARAYLDTAPDTAANVARKALDTELGLLADKLRLRMEYRHGVRNDTRMAHDFLTDIVAASKRCLLKKGPDNKYVVDSQGVKLLEDTDKLVVTWGNKGSHTFDVVKSEAAQLIDHCERSLALFRCQECDKAIHRLDDGNGTKQCSCGALKWRYDKA